MRVGLVADIHNDAASLSRALAALEARGVDLVVTLGDTCDVFQPDAGMVEVVRLLQARQAVGVWGNHDFVLCRTVDDWLVARYAGTPGLDYMAGMLPTLVVGGVIRQQPERVSRPEDLLPDSVARSTDFVPDAAVEKSSDHERE